MAIRKSFKDKPLQASFLDGKQKLDVSDANPYWRQRKLGSQREALIRASAVPLLPWEIIFYSKDAEQEMEFSFILVGI